MLARLLVLCVGLLCFSGCGGSDSSNPATYGPVPDGTQLEIRGVADGSVVSRNHLYITVDRSNAFFRKYDSIEYTLDTQLSNSTASFDGKDIIELPPIPVYKAGVHQFAVWGIMKGSIEAGKKITFTVNYQLEKAGVGKYAGDRTVYTKAAGDDYSNMRVEFVTYSASKRGMNLVDGGMKIDSLDGISSSFSGSTNIDSAIGIDKPYTTVDYQMNPAAGSVAGNITAVGTAYNHFMELLLFQGPDASTGGDLRLYRNDAATKVISAYVSTLNGYNPKSEMGAVITLQSFDNVNFFGHLRLWEKGKGKVWTYQVAAYADPGGLSSEKNGLELWPSISTSYRDDFLVGTVPYPNSYSLVNPPSLPFSMIPQGISSRMTVVTDSAGKLKINNLRLVLGDLYDAAPDSIEMKMTY